MCTLRSNFGIALKAHFAYCALVRSCHSTLWRSSVPSVDRISSLTHYYHPNIMSAEEEKVAPVAVVAEEPVQVDEKPKSEKKVKEKTPKSPKAPKKSAEKKPDHDTGVDAPPAAEEKLVEKNLVEEEKVTVEKPSESAAVADEKVEAAEAPKKDKKEKKEKKAKEDAATPVADDKKEEKKPEQAAAPVRGRSNSKALLKTTQQLEEEADTAETIRLWHQPGNVRSGRILWLLKELEGTVVEHLKVTAVSSHKDKRDAIVAVNPTGEVPTLRFGNPGFSLFEPGTLFFCHEIDVAPSHRFQIAKFHFYIAKLMAPIAPYSLRFSVYFLYLILTTNLFTPLSSLVPLSQPLNPFETL